MSIFNKIFHWTQAVECWKRFIISHKNHHLMIQIFARFFSVVDCYSFRVLFWISIKIIWLSGLWLRCDPFRLAKTLKFYNFLTFKFSKWNTVTTWNPFWYFQCYLLTIGRPKLVIKEERNTPLLHCFNHNRRWES